MTYTLCDTIIVHARDVSAVLLCSCFVILFFQALVFFVTSRRLLSRLPARLARPCWAQAGVCRAGRRGGAADAASRLYGEEVRIPVVVVYCKYIVQAIVSRDHTSKNYVCVCVFVCCFFSFFFSFRRLIVLFLRSIVGVV